MSEWSSKLGFVFAVIGSAVGLGNIWRFPFQVGNNGGGAFLIPYLFATFFFGLPLMVVAIKAGERMGTDIVKSFSEMKKGYFGWFIAVVATLILSYYLVITGWVIAFILFSLTGFTTSFGEFTSSLKPLVYWIVALGFTGLIVSYGVEDGIERAASIFIPLIFIFLAVLAVYNSTLSGFGEAMDFFLNPDYAVLMEPRIWRSAFGQAFFSLSLGMGILLTYGSYIGDEMNIPKLSVIIALSNFAVAFLGGLVIFPVVFTKGLEPSQGAKLAFVTLPSAMAGLPFGNVLGAVFFSLLFLAAVSSSISLLEVPVAVAIGRGTSRTRAIGSMLVILFMAGLPSALSYTSAGVSMSGMPFLDFIDESISDIGLPITALIIAVTFTWLTDEEITDVKTIDVIVRYLVPAALVVLMATEVVYPV
ncbi:MAG: sodium-dependent transporter [Halobacteria archaeon]